MLLVHPEFLRSAEKMGTELANFMGAMTITCHNDPISAGRYDEMRVSKNRGSVAEEQHE